MIYIVDSLTGEVITREPTPEEIARDNAVEQDRLARVAALEAEEAEAYIEAAAILEAEEAAKESARAKLAALGLTEAEVAALVK
jgi:hypothetical protein